jgi:hypothetical protein
LLYLSADHFGFGPHQEFILVADILAGKVRINVAPALISASSDMAMNAVDLFPDFLDVTINLVKSLSNRRDKGILPAINVILTLLNNSYRNMQILIFTGGHYRFTFLVDFLVVGFFFADDFDPEGFFTPLHFSCQSFGTASPRPAFAPKAWH